MNPPFRSGDLGLFFRALREGRKYWPHILCLFLLSLLATPFALLQPLPLKIAVDTVLESKPLPEFLEHVVPSSLTSSKTRLLWFAIGLLVATRWLGKLQGVVQSLVHTWTAEKLSLEFRSRLFGKAQQLSLAYHDKSGPADLMYRIRSDSQAIEYLAMYGVIPIVTAVITMISMIYVVWQIDRTLAMIGLLVAPVLFLASNLFRRPLRQLSHQAKRRESATMAVLHEVLSALRVVKAFGREDHERGRYIQQSRQAIRSRLRLVLAKGNLGLLTSATTAIGHGAVLYVGVLHVQQEVITLGSLLLVLGYVRTLFNPLRMLGTQVAKLQSYLASAERAFLILDEEPEVQEHPQAQGLTRACGAFAFREVSFEYGKGRPVLHQITFDVEVGERLGIAGRTGAGKSTLISLLLRFYDPTDGAILLDGVDLRNYKLANLRDQYAIVLQEPVLFSTTIADNIAYGRAGATDREIIAAAEAANVHQFITTLADGYNTEVGERGQCLSGGERQRIALARAFLKDAPVLILDEPTSSVDLGTEALIIDAMHRLMQGRTTFMIAHRLETLKQCDRMLVLDHGRLQSIETDVVEAVERGTAAGTLEALVQP